MRNLKKLIEYLPPFLQDIREYKKIFNAEDIELKKLDKNLKSLLTEVIVKTAEGYGLDRYEKIYNIDTNKQDIATRRIMILSKINNRVPYNLNWLKNKLDNLVGESNYKITENTNTYEIKIEISAIFNDIAVILNKDLKEQLPANLIITVDLFQTEQCIQYFAGIVHVGDNIKLRQVI